MSTLVRAAATDSLEPEILTFTESAEEEDPAFPTMTVAPVSFSMDWTVDPLWPTIARALLEGISKSIEIRELEAAS